jgi:transcriptional regulator with XRE-family HTH domain
MAQDQKWPWAIFVLGDSKMEKAKTLKESLKVRQKRGEEWRKFRKDHLYTQRRFAEALSCSPRTVQYTENGTTTPILGLLRRFEALKAQHTSQQDKDWAA